MSTCTCGALVEHNDPFNPYSGNKCSSCFIGYIEKKILNGVPRRVRGHPILVAVSGGKDSLALLSVLFTFRQELKIPSITVVILEEEILDIKHERQQTIQYLKNHFSGLPIIYTNYSNLFGYSLPDLVATNDAIKLGYTPCAICGVFRKQALFNLALQHGINFIALGTTLEDETATTLLNVVRGISRTKKNQISTSNIDEHFKFPERIKPLARISEDLIRTYIKIKQIPTISKPCPYAKRSLRSEITPFISSLKSRDPQGSFLYNILKTRHLLKEMTIPQQPLYQCERCQMISHQILCPSCRIIVKLLKSDK